MILASLVLSSAISKYVQRSGVENWPHVKGIVLFSGVEEKKIYKTKKTTTFGKKYYLRYVLRINYSYAVDGNEYSGKNFNLDDATQSSRVLLDGAGISYASKELALKAVTKFKKGTAVKVYYNPKNPKIASLSHSNASFIPILAAVGFVGLAVLTLLIALEKIKPENLPWRKIR